MAFNAQTWVPGWPSTKLRETTGNEDDLLNRLYAGESESHTHDGADALELDNATETWRGALRFLVRMGLFGGAGIAAGSANTIWLTDDGTSSGNNIFDGTGPPNSMPKVMVYVGISGSGADPEDHVWGVDGIGHGRGVNVPNFPSGNAGDTDYVSNINFQAGKMYVQICNEAASAYNYYCVVAVGKSA